jgi:hypothetical protein
MHVVRKLLFVGSAAAVALICSASGAGILQGVGGPDAQAAVDDLGARLTYSIAQWQPASGYVPMEYPTDGSWERMAAAAGR